MKASEKGSLGNAAAALLTTAFLLILLGCSYFASEKHLPNDERLPSAELFRRKSECEKYASRIEQEYKAEWREQGVKGGPSFPYPSVERMFYSPTRNSCVAAIAYSYYVSQKDEWYHVEILDVLTKEKIWRNSYQGEQAVYWETDMEKQIEQLSRVESASGDQPSH